MGPMYGGSVWCVSSVWSDYSCLRECGVFGTELGCRYKVFSVHIVCSTVQHEHAPLTACTPSLPVKNSPCTNVLYILLVVCHCSTTVNIMIFHVCVCSGIQFAFKRIGQKKFFAYSWKPWRSATLSLLRPGSMVSV